MNYINPLRERLAAGKVLRGAWISSPSMVTAEAIAGLGFDYVCADMQHGVIDYTDAVPMFAAIQAQGAVPIARLLANEWTSIGKIVDAGALGIVVPMVNTAAEAAAVVEATRYPPRGKRSFGPTRASVAIGSRDIADLEQVFIAVMVETKTGLDNVEEIAATEGVDAVYVGPNDLALALGVPGDYEPQDPVHLEALARIRQACAAAGKIAGIHCVNGAMAGRRLTQGFRMTTVINDVALVRSAGAVELAQAVPGSR